MVTDFEWAVARRGRVGWGVEDQERSWRSGVREGRGRMILLVSVPVSRGGIVAVVEVLS